METVDNKGSYDYVLAIIRPTKPKKLLDMPAGKIPSIINLRIKVVTLYVLGIYVFCAVGRSGKISADS